ARIAPRTAQAPRLHRSRPRAAAWPRRASHQCALARRDRSLDSRRGHSGATPGHAMTFGPMPLDEALGAVSAMPIVIATGVARTVVVYRALNEPPEIASEEACTRGRARRRGGGGRCSAGPCPSDS